MVDLINKHYLNNKLYNLELNTSVLELYFSATVSVSYVLFKTT